MKFGIIRELILPMAMLSGVGGYFIISRVGFLEPDVPGIKMIVFYLVPILIFTQLLLTFSRIKMNELRSTPWHGWFILIQVLLISICTLLLRLLPLI